jgi:pimeloyl-ACP methyl ester carboxylesterase
VRRVAAYGGTYGPMGEALNPETTRFSSPPTAETDDIRYQRERYQEVAGDAGNWGEIYKKVGEIRWEGFSREELASIAAPVLILAGDHDFVRVEHAVEASRLIPGAEIAVIPDASHFVLYSEPERVIPIIQHFLEKPDQRAPLATAGTGYYPGRTR